MKLEPLSSPRRQMRVHIHSRTLVLGRRRQTLRGSSTLQRPARGFRRPQEGSKKAQEVSKTGTVCPLCFTSKLNRILFRRKRFLRWQSLAHHKNKLDSCSLGIFPQPGIQRLLFRSPRKDRWKTDQGTWHDGVSAVHLGGLPLRLRAVQLMVRQEQNGLELTVEGRRH